MKLSSFVYISTFVFMLFLCELTFSRSDPTGELETYSMNGTAPDSNSTYTSTFSTVPSAGADERNPRNVPSLSDNGTLSDMTGNELNNSAVVSDDASDGGIISTTTGNEGIINTTAVSEHYTASSTNTTPVSEHYTASSTNTTPVSEHYTASSTNTTPHNTANTSDESIDSSVNDGNSSSSSSNRSVEESTKCPEMCFCPQYGAWSKYLVPHLRQYLGSTADKYNDYVMQLLLLQEFANNAESIKSILGHLFDRVHAEGNSDHILSFWWARFGITACLLKANTTFYLNAETEARLFPQVRFKQKQRKLLSKAQDTTQTDDDSDEITEDSQLDKSQLYNISFTCKEGAKVVVTKETSLFRYGRWSSTGCQISTEGILTLNRNWSLISLEVTNEDALWFQNVTVSEIKDGTAPGRLGDKKNESGVQLGNGSLSNSSLETPRLERDTVFPSITEIGLTNITLSLKQLGQVLVWFQKAEQLSLKNNSLASFNCTQLIPTPATWGTLVLSFSGLTSVPACILRTSLVSLDLSKNSISNISVFQFPRFVPSRKLESLNLNSNNIQDIGIFTDLRSLEFLYLADNKITSLNKLSFTRLPELSVLDLSHNLLHKLDPGSFKSLIRVQILDLRHNHLQHFDRTVTPLRVKPAMDCKIHLNNNRLSHPPFQSNNYDPGPSIFVFASDNPFACDCAMVDYTARTRNSSLTAIYSERSDMRCVYPSHLKGVLLDAIAFNDTCPVVSDCPSGCTCNLNHSNSVVTVDCTDVHHFESPAALPQTHKLRIEFQSVNKTQTFTAFRDSEYLNRAISVNISGRGLTHIPEFMCEALKQAEVLDLTFNKLQRLPTCFQSRPKAWPTLELRLADNPWSCDCDAVTLGSWLAEMKNGTAKNGVRVSDAMDVWCNADTEPGVRVAEWDSSDCTPKNYLPWAVTLGVVLALAAVLGPLLYVYRLQAMVGIHARFHVRPFTRTVRYKEEDFDHEALVVHGTSIKGMEWVQNSLLPRTQDSHHRVCIPERDFTPGSSLAETYSSSVACSKATLCLLNKDVAADEWWLYAFQLARAENARRPHMKFLLVLLEAVEDVRLPEEVGEFIKTNTYLSVEDPWFWKKLFYYLPDPPKDSPVKKMDI